MNEYQIQATKTALYPDSGSNLLYPVLGLCGETGEIAEKVKKMIRDDAGILTDERKASLIKELGDVLWYLSQVARELNVSLEDVAKVNIEKLASRHERHKLNGSGDER